MKKLNYLLLLLCLMGTNAFSQTQVAFEEAKKRPGAQVSSDGKLVINDLARIHGYGKNYDPDIYSPKSVTYSKDGKKIYVNSLEGCKTVVYDAQTREKLKVISHNFDSGKGNLWLPKSGYYDFTHYADGEDRKFSGKPVEAALSKDGRYLFVPYYRRTFDINAQDPSALAVIDTQTDEIVAVTETGPLPKMVKVSNDGKLLAITHWGNNTVGLMDISDTNPRNWRHLEPITIGRKLDLNYSLTTPVNRDSGSGYLLRGTVFLPGDSIMLVSGMAGPVAVIDVKKREWIGMINSLQSVRHITMNNGMLYMSRNTAGEVVSVPIDEVVKAISAQRRSKRDFTVEGIRKVKVGSGARTLKTSPSGKYIFVACNSSSQLYVVDSEEMKVIASIEADDYPVGLDVSPDGRQVITTSQGKNGKGGNAVDFFEVTYLEPELVPEPEEPLATETIGNASTAQDSVKTDSLNATENNDEVDHKRTGWIIGFCIGIALLIAIFLKSKNK